MRKMILISSLSLALPALALAHAGGVDQYGGHNDKATGKYHFHQLNGKKLAEPQEGEDPAKNGGKVSAKVEKAEAKAEKKEKISKAEKKAEKAEAKAEVKEKAEKKAGKAKKEKTEEEEKPAKAKKSKKAKK